MQLADDGAFAAFAKKVEADKEAKANRGSFSGQQKEYDEIKWKGLVTGETTIVRLVGNPPASMTPGFKGDSTTAKEIYFSKVKNDDGKIVQIKLPPHADDPRDEHPIWKVINEVKAVDWIPDPSNPGKKKKVFKYENYPWFDKVVHGGYDPKKDEFSYKTSKGWGGQEVVIMNVIDREDNWCRENKHTKLLSKKVNTSKDGTTEYPTVGVPSYGFITQLANLIGRYGSWEKYDLAIRRTGQTNPPYEVKAATIFANAGLAESEIGTVKMGFISKEGTLTDEEKSWARYEISKLYAPTTYNKILTHLGATIKAIDADLRTNFFEEIQGLAEQEKKEFEEKYGTSANVEVSDEPATDDSELSPLDESSILAAPSNVSTAATVTPTTPAATEKPAPTVTRTFAAPSSTPATYNAGLSADKIALLKGWSSLTPEEQAQIKDVVLNADGTIKEVVYSETSAPTIQCIDAQGQGCGYFSPSDFSHCPVCGASYIDE
jgi:hypothetical protein